MKVIHIMLFKLVKDVFCQRKIGLDQLIGKEYFIQDYCNRGQRWTQLPGNKRLGEGVVKVQEWVNRKWTT